MSCNLIQLSGSALDLALHDPYWNYVIALMHFDGANGAKTYVDEKGHNVYNFNNAAISTSQSLLGGSSLWLPATGDHIGVSATGNEFSLNSDDFTLELAYYRASGSWGRMVGNYQWRGGYQGGWYLTLGADGSMAFVTSTSLISVGAGSVKDGQWNRIAVVRQGQTFSIYVGGVRLGSVVPSAGAQNIPDPVGGYAKDLRFGCKVTDNSAFDDFLPGYYDEFRLTRGVARYTGDSYPLLSSKFPASL